MVRGATTQEQPLQMPFPAAHGAHGQKERRGDKGGGRSPANAPTPSRGGRSGGRDHGGNGGRERGPISALEELMRRQGVDEAWNALEEMQSQGTITDKYTVSRMLMKTVGDGRTRLNNARVYRAIGVVERFIEMQPHDVDEVLFNALLDTCGRLKDLSRLEATVQRMKALKVNPSPVTLGILVKTYGQAGDIQKVLQVWSEMDTQRVQANAVTYGCMIDACVKCGHLATAVEIFTGMRETGKHRNTILYTTLIKGYGLEKDLNSALELFREMPQEGVPYNTITYNSMIDACVKSGDLSTAEHLLREIADTSSALEPDLITFSTLLKGYCHIGDLDKALPLIEAIKARGLRCDELVYNTLMDGCVKANDVTAGVGLFEEMVQAGMRPSTITHSILSRLYQRAGYEEDANEAVAQLYLHHGIERPVGGDRGKGAGRRGQRSPAGQGGPPQNSPLGSPMSGFGVRHERSDSCWSGWSETQSSCGFDAYSMASGASTPHGSPMTSHQTGAFVPFDSMRGMPPPLPGMGGSDTPHSSCRGSTPVNGSFHTSPIGSPSMPPYGEQQQHQQQGQVMGIGMTPSMQAQGMQSLPPWPFTQQGMEQPQFFTQAAPQQQPIQAPQGFVSPMQSSTNVEQPQFFTQAPQGFVSPMQSHSNAEPCFQLPGPPPQDFGYGQQAFFESWTPTGHQVVGVQMNGGNGQNPFCL